MNNISEILEGKGDFESIKFPEGEPKGVIPLMETDLGYRKEKSEYEKRIRKMFDEDDETYRKLFIRVKGYRKRVDSKKSFVDLYKNIEKETERLDNLISKEKQKIFNKAKKNIAVLEDLVYQRRRTYNLNWCVKDENRRGVFRKVALPKNGEIFNVNDLNIDYISALFKTDSHLLLTKEVHIKTIEQITQKLRDLKIDIDVDSRVGVPNHYQYSRGGVRPQSINVSSVVREIKTTNILKPKARWLGKESIASSICRIAEIAKKHGLSYRKLFFDNFIKSLSYVKIVDDYLRSDTFGEFNGPSVLVEIFSPSGSHMYSSEKPKEPLTVRLPFLAFSNADPVELPTVIYDLCMYKNRTYSLQQKTEEVPEKGDLIGRFYGDPSDEQYIYKMILGSKYKHSSLGSAVDLTSQQYINIVKHFEGNEVPSKEELDNINQHKIENIKIFMAEKLCELLLNKGIDQNITDEKGNVIIAPRVIILERHIRELINSKTIVMKPSPLKNKISDILNSFAPKFSDINNEANKIRAEHIKKNKAYENYRLNKRNTLPEERVLIGHIVPKVKSDTAPPSLEDLIAANLDD